MKHDVIQYERIYNLLKNRIESGILPVGARLPGRSVLCGEFGTSERTIRRALELLEQDGYLENCAPEEARCVFGLCRPAFTGGRWNQKSGCRPDK